MEANYVSSGGYCSQLRIHAYAVQPEAVKTPLVVTDGVAPRLGTVVPTVPEQVASFMIGEFEQKSRTIPRSVVMAVPVGIVKFTLYDVVAELPVVAEELN